MSCLLNSLYLSLDNTTSSCARSPEICRCHLSYIYFKLSASQTLYPASHFENLVGYLQQPYKTCTPQLPPQKSREVVAQTYKFISFYDLKPAASLRIRHIHLISEFKSHVSTLFINLEHGRLLFIRDHLSLEWLLATDIKCEVDSEFF